MNQPTVIGQRPTAVASTTVPLPPLAPTGAGQALVPYTPPADFPVALQPEELSQVQQHLAGVSILAITQRDLATLENQREVDLNRVLDGFLSRIDQFDNPQIYKLFKALSQGVDDSKLPDLADRIMNNKLSLWESVALTFSSKKGREKATEEGLDELRRLITGKTKTLTDLVHQMEKDLAGEQHKLDEEISSFEQLKNAYRDRFRDFAVSTAFLQAFLAKAKDEVARRKQSLNLADPGQKAEADELDDKLQALESRALAVEGLLTRLPAEQVMIRQLQNAGISTLQETTTTAMARFASIKMTLIDLNGTMVIKNVQRAAQTGAALDRQLASVQSKLAKDVVTTAANAPGDNRVAQAQAIQKIVADTQAINAIVDTARQSNAAKFGEARQMLSKARQDLVAVGQKVQPGASLSR